MHTTEQLVTELFLLRLKFVLKILRRM